jgi:simple sugar transport system permease protein
MQKSSSRWTGLLFQLAAIVLALGFTTAVLLLTKGQPFAAYQNIILGSVGSITKFADVLVAWVPLLLAASGVLMTFAAGLWNIGIEGQITVGAIFTTWILRMLQDSSMPGWSVILLGFLAGMRGGALWAALAGALKTYGGVNEIFGGLGLNFVATAMTLWLIFGPWKRPGVGSMSGTQPFPQTLWLPQIEGLRLSWWSLGIGLIGLVLVYAILQGTYIGLKLKAVGKNARAAFLTQPRREIALRAALIALETVATTIDRSLLRWSRR